MAKVHVEYDTNDKTAKCQVDGKPVDNLHAVSLDRKYSEGEDKEPKFYFTMHQLEKDKEHDMMTHHRTMAAERVPAGAKAAAADGLPGHKVVSTAERATAGAGDAKAGHAKAVADIVDYLTQGD